MAWSEVITEVRGNPAGGPAARRKGKPMAKRKLSDKQIRFFGTARQRANLTRRRAAARVKGSLKRTRPKTTSHRSKAKRMVSNPAPEMLALTLGNPTWRGTTMKAKLAKNAGVRSHHGQKNPARHGDGGKMTVHHKPRRGNPGALGSPMDWITGGAGVLTGVVGTRALPQLILGASNTGVMGYLANGITAAGLGFIAHMVFPRNRVLVPSVVAGGFAALIARVIGDYTSYGQYLTLTGVGDYMVSNAVAPQRIVDPRHAIVEVPTGWGSAPPLAISSSGVDGSDLASSGVDLGRRAGVC
jgi:hypothetical protein